MAVLEIRKRVGAAVVGVALLLAPGTVIAGGPLNADQEASTTADNVATNAVVAAQALQVVSQFVGIADTPAAAAALTTLEAALEGAEPGSPAVAAALAAALPALITPEVAENPPPLTAEQTETALTLVTQMISSLQALGVSDAPTLTALSASLAARLG